MSKLKRNQILIFLFGILSVTCFVGFFALGTLWIYPIFGLVLLEMIAACLAISDVMQTKHSLLRNYPLIGRLRWIMERERPKIQQYFVEDDIRGAPVNKQKRSDIIQKGKDTLNTTPFGTMLDMYQQGYEFIRHSLYPIDPKNVKELRVNVGNYSASILNISAMSYGSLSSRAIHALNLGAKMGNFFHNTGEGGISPHHLMGGDVCFQIGTGYFGAGKTVNGKRVFDEAAYLMSILSPAVKLIEIKLSQGAKPGHGGMLPASKNTPIIAKIRGIEPGIAVLSPPYHSAFSNAMELVGFVEYIKRISKGKPVGIKLCLGDVDEFRDLAKTMALTNLIPDFITIDGGEGGTGSAPLVFTNWVGSPLVDALIEIDQTLKDYGIREKTKIIASGKITTSFDIVKMLSLGADLVNVARAFMISIGCIQARECNNNTCPVGVATQDPDLEQGLDVDEKSKRAFNYHRKVNDELKDILAAMGLSSTKQLNPSKISVRCHDGEIKTYQEIIDHRKARLLEAQSLYRI